MAHCATACAACKPCASWPTTGADAPALRGPLRFEQVAVLFADGICAGFLLATKIGRRLGRARLATQPAGLPTGVSAAEACAFAVIGLVLAFAFSDAATRFEVRRHLITNEINATGTAYLRLDLMPAEAKLKLQWQFREYVDVSRSMYRSADNPEVGAAGWDARCPCSWPSGAMQYRPARHPAPIHRQ